MLDHETRAAILRLRQEGHGTRFIARAVGVARASVQRVLEQGHPEVPPRLQPGVLDAYEEEIRGLEQVCKGNLVRVHEELQARHGVVVPYSTLTRFCRSRKIGVVPKKASGRYHFEPGQEMQHDTSPHDVEVGGRVRRLQCASLILCFSRRRFIQCYPKWDRFHARIFLTAALQYLDGAAERCMVDNSSVILHGGTGPDAVISPEMAAFSKHFGFEFKAHLVGDANRSGRVERPFFHVETNFYPGRTFTDLADLNAQAIAWCDKVHGKFHEGCQAVPDHLYAIERPALKRLPAYIPEPTAIHPRRVDVEGFVRLHTNRYSAPEELIGVDVEVHERADTVVLFHGHRKLIEHGKRPYGANQRVLAPEHRRRWARVQKPGPSAEEVALRAAGPAMAALCDALRARHGGQALRAMRRLRRIWLDYPDALVEPVVARALEHGLVDLDRIEAMVLRSVHGDFFRLPTDPVEDPHG